MTNLDKVRQRLGEWGWEFTDRGDAVELFFDESAPLVIPSKEEWDGFCVELKSYNDILSLGSCPPPEYGLPNSWTIKQV